MTTKVSIWDCGCGVEIESEAGKMKVIHSGGTPCDQILSGTRFGLPIEQVADIVLRKWLKSYEGGKAAARENDLRVTISRDGEEATVAA